MSSPYQQPAAASFKSIDFFDLRPAIVHAISHYYFGELFASDFLFASSLTLPYV
jgi:hypothetical protein